MVIDEVGCYDGRSYMGRRIRRRVGQVVQRFEGFYSVVIDGEVVTVPSGEVRPLRWDSVNADAR